MVYVWLNGLLDEKAEENASHEADFLKLDCSKAKAVLTGIPAGISSNVQNLPYNPQDGYILEQNDFVIIRLG